jgi:hypothetical protein
MGEWEQQEIEKFGFVYDEEAGFYFDPITCLYMDREDAFATITSRSNLVSEGESIIGPDGEDWSRGRHSFELPTGEERERLLERARHHAVAKAWYRGSDDE